MLKFFQQILNIIFPITCTNCGEYLSIDNTDRLCKSCWSSIKRIDGLICKTCGIALPDGGMYCYRCKRTNFHFLCIRAAGYYEGILKNIIHKYKYYHKDFLARPLSRLLEETIIKYPYIAQVDLIIPIPIHWLKRFFRGYNQSELLARYVSKFIGKRIMTNNLKKIKYTKSQTKLKRQERFLNLKDKFILSNPLDIKNKSILLIDDISTTGATFEECARLLKKAGANKIYCLCVAKD